MTHLPNLLEIVTMLVLTQCSIDWRSVASSVVKILDCGFEAFDRGCPDAVQWEIESPAIMGTISCLFVYLHDDVYVTTSQRSPLFPEHVPQNWKWVHEDCRVSVGIQVEAFITIRKVP